MVTKVENVSFENNILNVDFLENGVYFLRIINIDNEIEIKKMIKID